MHADQGPEARHRQLIHILPHLLFPDTFERISSEGDKRLILAGFGDTTEKEIKKWSTVEIDRACSTRRAISKAHHQCTTRVRPVYASHTRFSCRFSDLPAPLHPPGARSCRA
ncbi:hypothetical protein DPM13_13820 [Paracoccus mutanolyticus]|uniref:Uncharacterized protein n=1 Tax=Paracoccus mutanolyticus TaxID=1499308 RepID=A0ABM6WSY7_9RHOB|nr:hypothetical protein [Paracoccus mutanolyticus]AWX93753.1 hypothetical protein DPM13_13820 [Paracoccus mutanolyticus]